MILIISAQQSNITSPIDRRFGRSPWFIQLDSESNQWRAFENPGAGQSGGAGVAAAQFAIDKQADVVISGDFGPHAVKAFQAANIEMRLFTDQIITVQEAVHQWTAGLLPQFP